jgi:AAA ATPase domain
VCARHRRRSRHREDDHLAGGSPSLSGARVWVLEARPAQREAKLSYAGLADLIGTVFEEKRTALPPVQQRGLAAALLRGDADETADPRATATGLVGILSALAAEAPVAVAIDDLHWLDPASQQALAFAVRRLPARVGLLLTRRVEQEEPLPFGLERALTPERVDSVAPDRSLSPRSTISYEIRLEPHCRDRS